MKLPPIIAFIMLFTSVEVCSFTVASIEYFFDEDPGPGNGTLVYGRDTVEINEVIDTSALSPGIHRIYARARDDTGTWGLPQSAAFLVPKTAPAFEERTVAAIEYFFDEDPGPGNGTLVYGRNTVEIDEVIATTALSPGIHRICVRALDDSGTWGMPQIHTFLVPRANQPGTLITQLEYFVDSDPGMGNGIPVAIMPGASINIDIALALGAIEHGNHSLCIRAKNNERAWGFPACCQFSDGIPAQLTLTVNEGILTLFWETLYGIDTYKVYSAPLPEGFYTEDTGGTFGPGNWTAPEVDPKRFYRVTSVYNE
ncbi:MAG: hypothetical protein R6T89_01100 [Candidatus Syntrophosphaera sp.]